MSAGEKTSTSSAILSSSELDPLLKDLTEKKLSFRRNVVSLAAELKDARSRLALQEQSFARESRTREVAETKVRSMEEEIGWLQKCLEERNEQLRASTSTSEQHVKELDDLKSQFSVTQATAESSALSAQSAQAQCLTLLRELDQKNSALKQHEIRVNKLGEQLDILQKDLESKELSQMQLKDEVLRVEKEIMNAVVIAGTKKDCELQKILAEVSPKNFENICKHLDAKDAEIARLRDEIMILSAHWKHKAKELESELERHRRAHQELKKRVLKLEFCLQEARNQTRRLQRMGEKRDLAIKELRDQLAIKEQNGTACNGKQNFWESSGFKIVVSMSMLVLVVFAKR